MKIKMVTQILLVICLVHISFLQQFSCDTIDLRYKHGVSYEGIKAAIREAQGIFTHAPSTVVTIKIPSGEFEIKPPSHKQQAIIFSGTQPGIGGRLILEGACCSCTTLKIPHGHSAMRGRNVKRLTVRNLTFKRNHPIVSQGTVISKGKGYVILQIANGFPWMETIFDPSWWQGRYLRRYRNVNGRCELIVKDNPQIAYNRYQNLGGGKFKFHLSHSVDPNYNPGDLIGIKSKCCNQYGRDTYWFCGAHDVHFDRLRFKGSSRGVFRCQVSNIRVSNNIIKKENKGWCLATSADGPNIGQPDDPPVFDATVENLIAEGTGDDSVAFFNVKRGVIRNCKIRDSFARGILLYKSEDVLLNNNILSRCPLLRCSQIPCKDVSRG